MLIIDASKGYEKDGKNNRLRACDIKRIVDTIRARSTQDEFSAVVSKKEIKENGYNLNLARYVDSSDDPETWDIRATMFGGIPDSEVDELSDFWEAMPGLKKQIFKAASKGYVSVRDIDIKDVINTHESVAKYRASFEAAFKGLYERLKSDLIDDILDVQSEPEKEIITAEIFKRIGKIALTDRYQAYQVLAEKWDIIAADLEMIQGEGFEAINQVDPNMVIKKKDKDSDEVPEVQEGWRGHILPFDLIQRELLTEEFEALNAMEKRLSEISVLYTEIIDSMEPEDKEGNSILNDTNDAFMSKEALKISCLESLRKRIHGQQRCVKWWRQSSRMRRRIFITTTLAWSGSLKRCAARKRRRPGSLYPTAR